MVSISDFRAEQYPTTDGLRCVSVWVPDDNAFMPLLAGLLYLPTRMFNYTGADAAKRAALAQMWVNAYAMNDWTGCMDCADVQDCIETDEGVQGALTQNIINNISSNESVIQALLETIAQQQAAGQPLSESASGGSMVDPAALKTDDVCDEDKVWTGCQYLSGYIDGLITDFFQQIASLAEDAKIAAAAAKAIPIVGQYADAALSFALAVQEKLSIDYAAASTQALRDSIACDWKCAAMKTCGLSADAAIEVMSARLGNVTFTDYLDFMEFAITGTFAGDQIVEVAYAMVLNAIKYGSQFGDNLGVRPIGTVMAIGASDPNSGWIEICAPCPESWEHTSPTDDDWNDYELLPFGGSTCVIEDNVIKAVEDVPPTNDMFSNFQRTLTGDVSLIRVHFTTDVDVDGTYEYRLYIDEELQEFITYEEDGEYVLEWSGEMTGEHVYRFLTGARGDPADGNFIWTTSIEWSGPNNNPFA